MLGLEAVGVQRVTPNKTLPRQQQLPMLGRTTQHHVEHKSTANFMQNMLLL